MSLLRTLKFITNHPLTRKSRLSSVSRFLKWQIASRLAPYPVIYPFIGDTRIIVRKGLAGATGNLYTGLHEFSDMSFLLHLLREGDLFADIGANIGSYTLLASGYRKAYTFSFEPAPSTFGFLESNIAINNIGNKVTALNIGLGSKPSVLKFTSGLDTVNHVVTEGETGTSFIEVKIDTLDNVLNGRVPVLLKIDVEGFETDVLTGASKTLSDHRLKAIIIELNGSGKRYGFDEEAIHQRLLDLGFAVFAYDGFRRQFNKAVQDYHGNFLYIRDPEFVQERLKTSAPINILGQSF